MRRMMVKFPPARLATVAALTVFGVPLTATTASPFDNLIPNAYHYGACYNQTVSNSSACQTDNASVSYYMDSAGEYELETVDRDAVTSAVNNQFQPTDLTFSYDSTPVFSGSGETDIVWQEGSTGLQPDWLAVTWCNDAVGGSLYACDQQYIRARGNGVINTKIACHETGHAVGLLHGLEADPPMANNSSALGCMVDPATIVSLGSNQVSQINSNY